MKTVKWELYWKREYSLFYSEGCLHVWQTLTKELCNKIPAVRSEGNNGWVTIYAEQGVRNDARKKLREELETRGTRRIIERMQRTGTAFIEGTKKLIISPKTTSEELARAYNKFYELYKTYGVSLWETFEANEVASLLFEEVVTELSKTTGCSREQLIASLSRPSQRTGPFAIADFFSGEKSRKKRISFLLTEYPWLTMIDPFVEPLTKKQAKDYIDSFTPPPKHDSVSNQKYTARQQHLINVYQDMLFVKDKRDEYRRKAFYAARPLLSETAKRLNLPLKDVGFLLPVDLLPAFHDVHTSHTMIHERKKRFVVEIIGNSETIQAGKNAVFLSDKQDISVDHVRGVIGSPGIVRGTVQVLRHIKDIADFKKGNVLVSVTTTVEATSAMQKAIAFVTDEGGIACHAAIVAREMKKPCIVGTKHATKVFNDGDIVEVDATTGIVKRISLSTIQPEKVPNPADYDFLWTIGFPYIFSDAHYYAGYAKQDFLLFLKGTSNTLFVGKAERQQLAKEGFQTGVTNYVSFEKKIKKKMGVYQTKIAHLRSEKITGISNEKLAGLLAQAAHLLIDMWLDYFPLEYHSFDGIAELASTGKNRTLEKNLKKISELKYAYRKLLNVTMYEPTILRPFLSEIESRISLPYPAENYRYTELIGLLHGKSVTIPDRSGYIVRGLFSNGEDCTGKKAEMLYKKFLTVDTAITQFTGVVANRGTYTGKVKKIMFSAGTDFAKEISAMDKGDILVSGSTGPEMILACKKAGAIITDEGGIISHAAIVSREFGIPSIVATKIATKVLNDGDIIEVDAINGIIRKLKPKDI